MASAAAVIRLALFDLDHTLLDGDSDVLWCDFLIDEGVLDRATFSARNAEVESGYRDGSITPAEFCGFFVGTLAGRRPDEWEPLRQRFLHTVIVPRLPEASRALVERHRHAGDRIVLTTATNRFLTELTAVRLGIATLLATECELDADGRYTGRVAGEPNMRDGKVHRLRAWLGEQGLDESAVHTTAYSDSMNDLPLLVWARAAVVVNADPRLEAEARTRGWPSMRTVPLR